MHRKHQYFEENHIFGQTIGCFTATLEIKLKNEKVSEK